MMARRVGEGKGGVRAVEAGDLQQCRWVFAVVQCLILSERLQHIGRAFDHCRGARYQQLMRQRDKARAAQVCYHRS